MSETVWYTMSPAEALEKLNVNPQEGLSTTEVNKRLEQYGPNALAESPPPSFWHRLLSQFNNFVIYILLFAAVISFFISLSENEPPYESIAIMAIVILNAVLGVVQEGRAEQALAALKKLSAPDAQILRNGRTIRVPANQVVPGDIVLLEAGDNIPADLRLIESINLSIQEASLTGESVPVEKYAKAPVAENAVLGDRHNIAYMSTVVTYGRGKGVVIATGMQTEIGKIAAQLQSTEIEQTPLQNRLNDLGRTLSIAALIICGLIFLMGTIRALSHSDTDLVKEIEESFLVAISLAIAAVPEGLPAVVTINLAIGMREMIQRNALIRRLPAVETLGSATAICSDKTGTLTQNQMTAVRLLVAGHRLDITGEGYAVEGGFQANGGAKDAHEWPETERLLLGGLLASDARLEDDEEAPTGYRMIGDPTEGALVVAAAKAGMWRKDMESEYPRVNEVPFDSTRKRMSTIHQLPDGGGYLVFVKGAPDIVIELCTHIYENGKAVAITPERRQHILDENQQMAGEALRVLAVAQRPLTSLPDKINAETIEHDLQLIGLVALRDPARPEVAEAIGKARHAGIKTTMVTGDYPDTAKAIAQEIGLLRDGGRVVSGAELEEMSDDELDTHLDEIDAFARVSPTHKVRIVESYQRRGHIVAMTGDGVNDAPALKRASIGVAMGITGTDVSKESADMILTDDNYASIVSAVEQGRVIYGNIRKFVYFLLSCNLAEISVIFIATLVGWPPLTPLQLLWLNLVTDGAPALALGVEKGDPNLMDQPPRSPEEPIINRDMRIGMVAQTIVMTITTLLAFAVGQSMEGDTLGLTMAFMTLSGAQLVRAYSSRSELYTVFRIGIFSNKYMQYAFFTSFVGLLLVIYVPFLQEVFETVPLSLEHWAVVLPLLLLPTIVAELTKPYLQYLHRQEKAPTA